MIGENFFKDKRTLKKEIITTDLAVVGGGMSGVCTAIAAARQGIKVTLIQDRPVLGGNASSEVRLWILGATSHMGNNNRWSREGGVIDEILLENLYKNKEGNPVIFDTIVLDKVIQEENIRLLLNTSVYDMEKNSENTISKVMGFCSQNETLYEIQAPIFCDASGDGVLAYQAGASYWFGAEDKLTYGEKFAPDVEKYGELLGHTIYFYSKDTGAPVEFIPPSYALKDITKIPRFGNIRSSEHGCKFWWLEYGGRKNTIHDTEEIKWELWSIVYGVWNYIKNSGKFEDVANMTLEWVGVIPGKRESRRFQGLYTLIQQDIVEQKIHDDSVAFGGWAIDLHPADGAYSELDGCTQYHSKGIYGIPYRCYVSKDIKNLFYAGRNISTSHVAHGSSRVMATSAMGGQAVGIAAAQCVKNNLQPAELLHPENFEAYRQLLNLNGQSIPHTGIVQNDNLVSTAKLTASSNLQLSTIPFDGKWYALNYPIAQMLPVVPHVNYHVEVEVEAEDTCELKVELRYAEKPYNYTPDTTIETQTFQLKKGVQQVSIAFKNSVPHAQYAFISFFGNETIKIRTSEKRYTGILSVLKKYNKAVNNNGKQVPPPNSGIDSFEFWCPVRRPEGHNIAMHISPAIEQFAVENLLNGFVRPTTQPNAWVADLNDEKPSLEISWDEAKTINSILLHFDSDFDHALESVQMGHPEQRIPFCIENFSLYDDENKLIAEVKGNYQTIRAIQLDKPITSKRITLQLEKADKHIPCSLFQIFIQ